MPSKCCFLGSSTPSPAAAVFTWEWKHSCCLSNLGFVTIVNKIFYGSVFYFLIIFTVCCLYTCMTYIHAIVCVSMCVYTWMPWYSCGEQKIHCGNQFSPSTMWLPGTKLRSSGQSSFFWKFVRFYSNAYEIQCEWACVLMCCGTRIYEHAHLSTYANRGLGLTLWARMMTNHQLACMWILGTWALVPTLTGQAASAPYLPSSRIAFHVQISIDHPFKIIWFFLTVLTCFLL